MDLASTIAERDGRHGPFTNVARISQGIKLAMASGRNWSSLQPDEREALAMIAHKCARILNGTAAEPESWVDIAGYAMLVADRLGGAK